LAPGSRQRGAARGQQGSAAAARSRRFALRLVIAAAAIGAALTVLPAPLPAADGELDRVTERTLGLPTAPVTIYEFSSFTCPHCATFHLETLPKIKTEYIDTGKAKLVFRDFPLDRLALAASVVSRCVKPAQYFGFIDILFRDQKAWATAKDPLGELKMRARIAGIGDDQVNACLSDQGLIAQLQQRRDAAAKEFGIKSTPTFVIGGETIEGNLPFETFRKAIEAALAKAG
jgi:protein-disulfide isomerase